MKIFFKVIYRLLCLFLCFIIVNLIIWTIKYWWVSNYSNILNEKDWQSSVSEISILKPQSWFSIFYSDEIEQNIDNPVQIIESEEIIEDEPKEYSNNPYDPDYEDEFNSFFGGTSEKKWEIKSVEEIEDFSEVWFKNDRDNAE